jgi:hypothetical protein
MINMETSLPEAYPGGWWDLVVHVRILFLHQSTTNMSAVQMWAYQQVHERMVGPAGAGAYAFFCLLCHKSSGVIGVRVSAYKEVHECMNKLG